ncbi:ribonucleoside-diphosphate reductase subunit alpha [Pullulanibacillus sp. KACC 23026]|uniref:ribonucleoside-diphosphate reductase subunit alpha n=1 Tax=Pullulanibacillus sp. KACC 23026 TaxID=3028315 RepID=UPI0023AEEFDB|nr:ribonucleoside-diphosphate reductase subunit alpha [Pullulanibacillus sp. KACC 23026]WEG14821.1 ribonucleoside-diphosphate reductase subunit alpha [Pullulanibacillus sp. KACC 23026]
MRGLNDCTLLPFYIIHSGYPLSGFLFRKGGSKMNRTLNLPNSLNKEWNEVQIRELIERIGEEFPKLNLQEFTNVVLRDLSEKHSFEHGTVTNQLILRSLERIDIDQPDWTFFASRIYLDHLYRSAAINRGYDPALKYGSFYHLISQLSSLGIYKKELIECYSRDEVNELETFINPDKDKLFNYIGLRTLADRYLSRDFDGAVFELPQERFMIISMTLMMKEPKSKRLSLIKEAYWALSNLYMTVATPTFANAGKSTGQLSSCFIDSVEDSLDGIMMNDMDVARLSKNGGGLGVYLGNIRSAGSDIQNYKGMASGILPWMKQLNDIAVNVDQLGQRQGAIAVYTDVWHMDILAFLDAKLNNGDERQRTHDLFTGVCLPDLFMEQVEKRGDWYLFDPHQVEKVMGFKLQDFYDEERGQGSFRTRYWECVNHPELTKKQLPAIEIMKKIMISQLETGTPYMFYRDEVNRMNANQHSGMIYCSNLCTEITQNMSPTTISEELVTEEGKIVVVKEPGDFVVCNLSSISLARAVKANVLERLISIQVRMLDNVIDINRLPVLQAQLTNQKYRAIGLGTFGWAHLLAIKGILWESDESVDYANELYEEIAYYTIKSSMELAKEKAPYPAFQHSDWQTGAYFTKRGYCNDNSRFDWEALKAEVRINGIRNGYLMAVAPNSTTAIIGGSSSGIDPIFNLFYSEEKKNYKIPVTAPDLDHRTYYYYMNSIGHLIDQKWSIKQTAARQQHIDQALSFNLYVQNTIKAKDLLDLHLLAWKNHLKTTYYTRSSSSEIENCEWCES